MMAECQGGGGRGGGDLLIKLFGKTIPVPESGDAKDLQQSSSSSTEHDHQDAQAPENASSDLSPQPEVVDAEDPGKSSSSPEAPPQPGGQREKLKKPDKVLACPRCSSMDTKFCYFNNYNVNQPRHFCKNCQRYWTAGGAMRNVPVGAGRRKNKHAAANAHFLHRVRAAAAALPAADALNGGTVLSFGAHGGGGAPHAGPALGPAGPACLDLARQLSHHLAAAPARNAGDAAGPCSEGSSNNNNGRIDEALAAAANHGGDGSAQQHPAASMNTGTTTTAVWPAYSCAPSPAAAAYFSSGIAIPIYPAAAAAPAGYWGCVVPGAWSLPWPAVQQGQGMGISSPSPTATTTSAAPSVSSSGAAESPHTPGLGKHRRDDHRKGDGGDGRNGGAAKVWAPKTIRIDDVDEVARSSIWSLIGINGDKKDGADAAGGRETKQLGMVFEPKQKKAGAMMATSSPPLLHHANPVALTRSVAFQEGS